MTDAQMADLHLIADSLSRLAQTEPHLEVAAIEARKALYALQGLTYCPVCGSHIAAESVRDDGIRQCAICYTLLKEPA